MYRLGREMRTTCEYERERSRQKSETECDTDDVLPSPPHSVTHSKTAMEKVLADEKVDISPDSKIWDPQRQYEKRLVTLMAKRAPVAATKGGKAGPTPRKGKASANGGDEVDDMEGDGGNGVDLLQDAPVESTPARSRPRPRPGPGAGSASRGRERSDDSALTELSDRLDDEEVAEDLAPMDEDLAGEEDEEADDERRRKRDDSIAESLPEVTNKRRRLVVD